MSAFSFRRFQRQPVIWWALVALVAGTAGALVTTSVASAQSSARKYGGLTPVAVFTHDLPAGRTLQASDLQTETRPRAFLPHTRLASAPVGRTLAQPVAAGDIATERNAGKAASSPTAALIGANERAIALSLQQTHPNLAIGDRVDVIATFSSEDPAGPPASVISTAARVVQLQDDSVMVAVPTADSPKVAFAVSNATIVLGLSGGPE